jgi:uncharacterized protein (DUF58 family)
MTARRLIASRAAAAAAAGLGLLLIALLFDAAPLFVPAVALVLIGSAAPAWVWFSATGATARRHLEAERVVEEQPLAATIEVRRSRLGLPGAEVIDPLTGSRLKVGRSLSLFSGARVANVKVVTRFARRGLQTLQPPSLVVTDPLELARVERVAAEPPQQLLVLPRTEPVRWLSVSRGGFFELPDGNSRAEAFAAVDVDGLRPYRPGTPASRIHWPAVARGAGLLERRLRADGDTRPLVVLDARGLGPPELLDAAVRAAASLTLELARSGGCGLLLSGEQRATAIDRELSAWPAAYARLAMVQSGPATRAPMLGRSGARLGPMVYVATRAPDRIAAMLSSHGHGPVVLVVPDQSLEGGRPPGVRGPMQATFEVSGCRGFLLGVRGETDGARRQRGRGPRMNLREAGRAMSAGEAGA